MEKENTDRCSQLKTCLEKVQKIYEEDQSKLSLAIAVLKQENKALTEKLVERDLEVDITTKLKKENEKLKNKVRLLQVEIGSRNSKISQLENTVQSNRKKSLKKLSDWERYGKTVEKCCTCKFQKKMCRQYNSAADGDGSLLKQSNASKLFFASPLKRCKSENDALAPMTEQYDTSINSPKTPTGNFLHESERDFVHETERDFVVDCKIQLASDDELDWPKSPSLTSTMKDTTQFRQSLKSDTIVIGDVSKHNFKKPLPINSTPSSKKFEALNSVDDLKKPMLCINACNNLETPVKMISLETSAELFSDVSPVKEPTCDKGVTHKSKNPKRTVDDGGDLSRLLTSKLDSIGAGKTKTRKKKGKSAYNINEDSFFNDDDLTTNVASSVKESSIPCATNVNSKVNKKPQVGIAIDQKEGQPCVKKEANLDNSTFFQNMLKKNKPEVDYKYNEVVRKKKDREVLNGFDCHECRRYYASDNLTEQQLKEVLKNCSKHRHKFAPAPDTPDEFWSIRFPDTQEYIAKGYMLDVDQSLPEHAKPRWQQKGKSRKRIKYQ